MTEINLKPAVVDKKSEQKKVILRKELFFNVSVLPKITFKAKKIGSWTIEKEERCNICWVNIKPGEEIKTCASCGNKFHKDHWREWVIARQYCPICKVKTTY